MAVPGCVLFPNSRVEKYGLKSRVIDSETGNPVRSAEVIDYYHAERRATTDFDGRFRLKPFVQWHAGYLISPIGYPILPFTGDAIDQSLTIRIVAQDYDEAAFKIQPYAEYRFPPKPPLQVCEAEQENGVFVVSYFAISKKIEIGKTSITTQPQAK